jgi:L-malate glycosyltransferase
LSLANKIVQVARGERLDVIHAHYAIPHATAAYLARQILASSHRLEPPKIITTLHGTDITLLGSDPSYSEAVAFCIEQSDGVTAVSESLKADTQRQLGIVRDIRVIPNFLDCSIHRRVHVPDLRRRFATDDERILIHVSNFRPVKRVPAVIDIFARVRHDVPARLLMVGDGPELGESVQRACTLGIANDVHFLGEQDQVAPLLSISDVFLLPSAQESFGLAALEAMACEVPVVASRVGGLPEVVSHGETGFLHEPGDLDQMAQSAIRLLTDRSLHARVAKAASRSVNQRFCDKKIVPVYEAYYEEVLGRD